MTEMRRTVLRARDVKLAGGDVLRVQMECDDDGSPRRLFIGRGFTDGLQGRPPVVVPGKKVGELVDAIRALEGDHEG